MRTGLVALLVCGCCTTPTYTRETLPGWFDLPVTGGEATLAALGIATDERAITFSLIARALNDRDARFSTAVQELSRIVAAAQLSGGVEGSLPIHVPTPLTADAWRRLLDVERENDLFARFVADRSALLLVQSLAATSDSIRALVTRDRDLLRFLYRLGAGGFTIAARSLQVNADRIVTPGGPGAEAIWQSLAGEPPSRASDFLRALSVKDNGRLAWYFDTIAQLDEARLQVVWPAAPAAERLANAHALYAAFRDADSQIRLADQPFRRSAADAWMVVSLSDIARSGLAGPAWAPLWELLFSEKDIDREQALRLVDPRSEAARLKGGDAGRVTLTWLTREIVMSAPRERRDRFEMFRLAQRVFPNATAADTPDIAVALSGFRRYRALLLTLERMEITSPATWAAAVESARLVDGHAGDDRAAIASFQGALALLERIRHVRTITRERADSLIRSLGEAVKSDRLVVPGVARWITQGLVPALPPLERPDAWTGVTAYESSILQALSGARATTPRTVEWEGLSYRVDRAASEGDRLRTLRRLLPSPGLDAAMASGDRRALADAMTALLYCVALGDPEGPAALSREVAQRHEFGLRSTALVREQRPWSLPEERQGDGPWHLQGSLLGLDAGLSRLALRRVSDGQMPSKPVLTLNDLATLTRTVVALVPEELLDADRDELAAAIVRGRQRVAAATTLAELQALAGAAKLSATARQALPWVIARQADIAPTFFSLRDLLWLGRPALTAEQLARWGVSGDGLDGRRVTTMPGSAPWEDYAGRSDQGQITTQVPDLTLRLIEETARLRLPAELIPALLAFAVEDYWHDTRARFADDYPRMVRQAAALESTRVEDYVAALAGSGGPLRAQ